MLSENFLKKINEYIMKIICRKFDKKVLVPRNRGYMLTKWTDDLPIEMFCAYDKVKYRLSTADVDILNEGWREITKKKAAELAAKRDGIEQSEN